MRYLPFILGLALVIYALVDCVRSDDSRLPVGLPKAVWVVLIILFPGIGAIAWLVVSRAARFSAPDRGARRPGTAAGGPRPSRRPAGPVAPDDDPDFLANLDRERRRREREAREKPDTDPTPGATDAPEDDPGPTVG
ncbi:PLD nuclease N-terminal domain-containing protein [Georgenia faecalis]|uniref:PLD nuclease N-terminal domain-containing protein n=1 Tax=Georgenia faecalis TaxID=2483799 RepID=UPI0019D2096F|nr:PLD nuclease N-terminal domain-containing protein [Georgenia faecalis]